MKVSRSLFPLLLVLSVILAVAQPSLAAPSAATNTAAPQANNQPTSQTGPAQATTVERPTQCGQIYKSAKFLYDCHGRWSPKGVQFFHPDFDGNNKTFYDGNYTARVNDGSIDYWLDKAQALGSNMLRIYVQLPNHSLPPTDEQYNPTSVGTIGDFARRANLRGMRLDVVLHNSSRFVMKPEQRQWINDFISYFNSNRNSDNPPYDPYRLNAAIAFVNLDNEINNQCARIDGQPPYDCYRSWPGVPQADTDYYVYIANRWALEFSSIFKDRGSPILLAVGLSSETTESGGFQAVDVFYMASSSGRLVDMVDILAPHNYTGFADRVRSRVRDYWGYQGPVVLEEFGFGTDQKLEKPELDEGPEVCRSNPYDSGCVNKAPYFTEVNANTVRTSDYAGASAYSLVDSRAKSCNSSSGYTGLYVFGNGYDCPDPGTHTHGDGNLKTTGSRVLYHNQNYNPTDVRRMYEAEDPGNTLSGGTSVASCNACSGGQKVGSLGHGGRLQFNHIHPNDGSLYQLDIYYTSVEDTQVYIKINGGPGYLYSFPNTGSLGTPGLVRTQFVLNAGVDNTVMILNDGGDAPDIDGLTIGQPTTPLPATLTPFPPATNTSLPTNTPTRTNTATNTPIPTSTPTNTPTFTPSNTPINTPTNTPSSTATNTPPPTNTPNPCRDHLKVAILSTDNTQPQGLVSSLRANPNFGGIATFNTRFTIPSASLLQQYGLVIAINNGGYGNAAAVGNVLADYQDGGGVVAAVSYSFAGAGNGLAGRWITAGYSPYQSSNNNLTGTATLGNYNAGEILMQGVTSLSATYRTSTSLANGANLIASWSDGTPLLAIKGRAIGITAYLGDTNGVSWSGDFAQLLANAGHVLHPGCSTPTASSTPLPPTSTPMATATATSINTASASASASHTPISTPTRTNTTTSPPTATATGTPATLPVYSDNLATGWEDWSWNTTVVFTNSSPIYSGSRSIAVTYNAAWAGLALYHAPLSVAPGNSLHFYAHGGSSGGQQVQVKLVDAAGNYGLGVALNSYLAAGSLLAGQWQEVTIPLTDLAVNSISRVVLQDLSGGSQSTFYLDEVSLRSGSASNPTATFTPASPSATPAPASPTASNTASAGNSSVYADQLAPGWEDWSWSSTTAFDNGNPVHAGSHSLAVTHTVAWGALYLHHPSFNVGSSSVLHFYVHGGSTGGQQVQVKVADESGNAVGGVNLADYLSGGIVAGEWLAVSIPVQAIAALPSISGLVFQDGSGRTQPSYYLDDVWLEGAGLAALAVSTSYNDVPRSSIFYDDIQYLTGKGIVQGRPNSGGGFDFQPQRAVSRGELAKVVVLAYGLSTSAPEQPSYPDVSRSDANYKYIRSATRAHLLSGYPDGRFHPYQAVTRVELAVILARQSGYSGDQTTTFRDLSPASFGYQAVASLVSHNIVHGAACSRGSDQCFRPSEPVTRAEMAKVVHHSVQPTR